MVETGDAAPDFTALLAHGDGDVDSFTLSESLDDGPVVLAFFPGAFTNTCTHEMETFQAQLTAFEAAGTAVYGVSVDTPFVLNEFRDQLGLTFGLISDANRELIEKFDISMVWEPHGLRDFSKRSVFVIDGDGEITYSWVCEETGVEPDYEAILEAAEAASA